LKNKHKDYSRLTRSTFLWLELCILLLMKFNIIIPLQLKCFEKVNGIKQKKFSTSYIQTAIDKTKMNSGDIYDKAARLLIELTRIHAFESGNKRTAFLTPKFILKNEGIFNIPDTVNNVKVMIGIRENYYSQD